MINYILTLQSQLQEVQNECLKQAKLAEASDYALQEALEQRAEKLRAAMKRALEAAIGAKS